MYIHPSFHRQFMISAKKIQDKIMTILPSQFVKMNIEIIILNLKIYAFSNPSTLI